MGRNERNEHGGNGRQVRKNSTRRRNRRQHRSGQHVHSWIAPGIICGHCWQCRVCGGTHPRYPLEDFLFAYAPFLALPGMPRGGRFDMSCAERECFTRWLQSTSTSPIDHRGPGGARVDTEGGMV